MRKILWLRYVMVLALALVTGAALMVVSHRVQRIERQIAKVERGIAHERDVVRVLNAEWAYLNNPERLDRLASLYLNLSLSPPEMMLSQVDGVDRFLPSDDIVMAQNVNLVSSEISEIVLSAALLPQDGGVR